MKKFKKGLFSENTPDLVISLRLEDFLAPNDLVFTIDREVSLLDLSEIEDTYSELGQKGYPPAGMLRIIFFGYTKGIRSGKDLSQACLSDLRFIYLARGLRPSKNSINDFRRKYHAHFAGLFKQIVQRCIELELTDTSTGFGDGSKIRANASAKRSKTLEQYDKWLSYLEADVAEIAKELEQQVAQEPEAEQGQNPPKPSAREAELKKKALIEKIRQRREQFQEQDQSDTRLNLTDEDAQVMKGKKKYHDTFYNVQVAVSEQQIILHNDVCTSSNDKQQLQGVVEGIKHNTERPLEEVICDSGYSSFDNDEYLEKEKINGLIPDQDFGKSYEDQPFHPSHFRFDSEADCYICPKDQKLVFWRNKKEKGYQWRVYRGEACQNCPFREECTKGKARTIARERRQDLRDKMRERLQSPSGKERYAKRRHLVEPVFGHFFRNLGYTYFHTRGLKKVKAEFNLMCIAYNLMKMAMFLVVFLLKNVLEPFIRAEKRLVAF